MILESFGLPVCIYLVFLVPLTTLLSAPVAVLSSELPPPPLFAVAADGAENFLS
jgi:hypothetical protein